MISKKLFCRSKVPSKKRIAQNKDEQQFLGAVRNGQYDEVWKYLKNGVDVDVCDIYGNTALHIACSKEDLSLIKLLVRNKANPNILSDESCKNSPLHILIEKGNAKMVKFLLENSVGIAINLQNGASECPLATSMRVLEGAYNDGNKEIFKMLLEHAAGPSVSDGQGVSLLERACRTEKLDVIKLLLEYGANPKCKTKDGGTLLELACCTGNEDIIKLLISYGAISDEITLRGLEQLGIKSMVDKDLPIIKGHEVDVEQFQRAVEECRYDEVSLLIQQGIDINDSNKLEDNVLNMVCRNDDKKMLRLLLEHGANPNMRGTCNEVPLVFAIQQKCDIDIIKLLLEYGANPNARDAWEQPMLNRVCYHGMVDIARLLLEYGANPNVMDMFGMTALEKVCFKDMELSKLLLEHGANPNKLNTNGETMLYVACRNGDVQTVNMLLEYNADLTGKSGNQELPLHVACRFGNEKVVDVLAKAYKNTESIYSLLQYYNDVSKDNKTPLQLARDSKNKVIHERLQHINTNAIIQCIVNNKFVDRA